MIASREIVCFVSVVFVAVCLVGVEALPPRLEAGHSCTLPDNTTGVCTPIEDCYWLISNLQHKTMNTSEIEQCSFVGGTSKSIVCCALAAVEEPHNETNKTNKTKSDENLESTPKPTNVTTDSRSSFVFSATDDGNSTMSKIEGVCAYYRHAVAAGEWRERIFYNILEGISVLEAEEFPHMVALGYRPELIRNNGYNYRCGGIIISEKFILTAAHCITHRSSPVRVRLGTTDIHSVREEHLREVLNITKHPEYNATANTNDIALIELKEALTFTPRVQPACLFPNNTDLKNGTDLTILGWGVASFETRELPNKLQKANISSFEFNSCNASLFDLNRRIHDPRLLRGLNQGQICAMDPTMDRDTCEGDSGGPLQLVNSDPVPMIVGLTSFGVSCGSPYPSVYTRVGHYIKWIEDIVWPNIDNRDGSD